MSASDHTILIVEDNEDNLVIYSTILSHSGYRVLEARDGQSGILMAQREHPDLILMDVSIPVVDGWEATRRLKADSTTANIPIIALTAHALDSDRERATAVGCDGYLPKPAEPRLVLSTVQTRLGDTAVA